MIKFQSIKIQNFLSFNDLTFNFKDKGLYLIEGKNGSGKSSLFEAIAWVLFGKTFKSIKESEIIHKLEEKNCLVNLKFTINDKQYQAIKTKKHDEYKDTTMLFVKINNTWENISGKDQLDTHKEIEKLLGLNFKVFQQSIMLSNLNKSFAEMTDADIKEIFDEILDLDVYSKLQDINSVKKAEINNKVSEILNSKSIINSNINNYFDTIENLKNDLQKAEQDNKEKISQSNDKIDKYNLDINKLQLEIKKIGDINVIKDNRAEHNNKLNDLLEKNENLNKIINKIKSTDLFVIETGIKSKELYIKNNQTEEVIIKYKEKDIKAKLKELDSLNEKLEKYTEIKNTYEVEFKTNRNKIDELIDVMDAIKDLSDCPTCKQKVSESHKKHIMSIYQNMIQGVHAQNAVIDTSSKNNITKLEEVKSKIKILNQELHEIQDNIDAYDKYIENKNKIDIYKNDIEGLTKEKIAVLKRIKDIETAIEIYSIDINKIKESIKEFDTNIENIKTLESAINNFNYKIKLEKEMIGKIDSNIGLMKERINTFITKFDTEKLKLKDIEDEIEKYNEDIKYYDYLAYAFSNQGIKSMLLQNITPILNTIASNFSSDITNGHININFETQTYIKSTKQWKEKFKINIENKDGGETYSANSMGEKAIIDLCILEALNYLVSLRAGKSFNISVYDESFGALDEINSEKVIKYLHNKAENNVIYVVSHDSGFKNYFDDNNIIKVKKVKKYTEII